MDISKVKLFELLRQKMAYQSERQSVLAQNIANADTPGYKPRDIKEPDFAAMLNHKKPSALVVTHQGHIHGNSASDSGRFRVIEGKSNDVTPNGNAVNIEEEMMKISENSMDYQAATSLYKKITDMIRIATGSNK